MTSQLTNLLDEAPLPYKPSILVRALGWQEGFGRLEGRMLYNVVAGDPTMIGSTVTTESLLKAGWRVEVVE